MASLIIGIDPGATGAVAAFLDGRLQTVRDMPTVLTAKGRPRVDAGALASLLRELAGALPGAMPSIDHAIVESVSARRDRA